MQTIKSFLLNSRILLVLLVLVLFAGCSDDEGSTGEPGTLDRLWSHEVIKGCGSCHGPMGEVEKGFHLVTKADFYNNLVGKNSNALSWLPYLKTSNCGENIHFKLVERNAPAKSAALMAISQTYSKGQSCTTAISTHQTLRISETVVNDFRDWIENGAKP